MTYQTILTSKGTTTIPKEIRDQLGVDPGMLITFTKNESTGEFVIKRAQTIGEVRAANKRALEKAGTEHKEYKSGAGFTAQVREKYRSA